jgi:steroid 5-alpha reductase family enzyme
MKRMVAFVLFACACIALVLTVASGGFSYLGTSIRAASPLRIVCEAAAALAFAAFACSIVTGDYSWVDRLWSTAPVAFIWYYAARNWGDWRTLTATLVFTAWGARLTFNFARKGGYSGTEDYRWPIMRARIPNPIAWQAFNLCFIATFQVGLLVLITLPLYALSKAAARPAGVGNVAFVAFLALSLALLCIETAADQQQWNFHRAKRLAAKGKSYADRFSADVQRGFLASGLFKHSRHPNYFSEIAQWWCLALAVLCVSVDPPWFLTGALVLTALFIGSTIFTEGLSAGKYPAYATYQRRVSPIIPWFGAIGDESHAAEQRVVAGSDRTE